MLQALQVDLSSKDLLKVLALLVVEQVEEWEQFQEQLALMVPLERALVVAQSLVR